MIKPFVVVKKRKQIKNKKRNMREKGFLLTRISRSMFFVLGLFMFLIAVNSVSAAGDGSIISTVEINDLTVNGPVLTNGDQYSEVANIGDLNNDGVNDLAVGAPYDDGDGSSRGAVYVSLMNSDGSVISTTKINNTTPNGPSLVNYDWYGATVAGIGDLDNDGVDDLAVGRVEGGEFYYGAVFIHFMNNDGSVKSTTLIDESTVNGPSLTGSDPYYGSSIANIGDFDGDGVDDLAVGALYDDGGGTDRGAVYIHFMNSDGSMKSTVKIDDATANGPVLSDRDGYGESIANIGDFDGDGVTDLAVGSSRNDTGGTDRGAVYIHFMNSNGSIKSTTRIDSTTTNGPVLVDYDSYGTSIANIGDFDGDGVTDLAVGVRGVDTGGASSGALDIHFMNSNGSIKSTTRIDSTTTNGPVLVDYDNYGNSVANIGDFDGNGVVDIAVGAYGDDAGGGTRGAIHIHFMGSDTVILEDIIIPDPTPTKMNTRVGEGYMSVDNGTITSTSSTTTAVNVTYRTTHVDAVFPTGTVTTEASNGNYNFENFTIQNITNNVKNEQPSSRVAFRLGVPSTSLNFSQNVNITAFVGEAYNNQEMDILYQNEGETTWNTHGTCTIESGNCTFQTNHATIYTINGNLQSTGDAPMNINTEVVDTLTLDCYETTSGTGNYDVTLGTTSNPGFVTAGTPAVGTSTCDTTTNDDQGYYLTIEDDNGATNTVLTHSDPNTAAIYEIQDLTAYTESTPNTQTWTAPTTKGLGFSVISFPDTTPTNNTLNGVWTETGSCPEGTTPDANNYAGIPDTPEAIAAVPEYSANLTTTNICYKVDVPTSQPSGIYTGSVTYTATSDASSYLN